MSFSTPNLKLAAVQQVDEHREDGLTIDAACAVVGCSRQQYQRWRNGKGLGNTKPTGRPKMLEFTPEEEREFRLLYLKKRSVWLACEIFAASGKQCRAETREKLLALLDKTARSGKRPSWPMSIRRACKTSQEEEDASRGAKHLSNVVPVGYRTMTYVNAEGVELPLGPLDLWESDDMSVNEPFRYTDPETGNETLGRQVLLTQSVQSLFWLGASPLGRPRDAYRVEDIADHFYNLVDLWGLPLMWRLERGPWENNFINGVPLDDKTATKSFGLGGERFAGKRWGALDDLIHITRAYDSRGKGSIEGSFNQLQNLMAHPDNGLTIGRTRGEYEAATKTMMRAHKGSSKDLAKFWTIDQCTDGLAKAMREFAQRPKERRALGGGMYVPEELFSKRGEKRALAAEDRWYFHPVKKLATVRQGQIVTTAPHYSKSFVFSVNGVRDDVHVDHGTKVLIAFHPGRPDFGCWIFNAEVGSSNRQSLAFGELILAEAPALAEQPQVDMRKRGKGSRDNPKKRASAAVRSNFRAIREAGQVEEPASEQVARDGVGNVVAVSRGARSAEGPKDPRNDAGATARPTRRGDAPKASRGTTPKSGERLSIEELEALEAETSQF